MVVLPAWMLIEGATFAGWASLSLKQQRKTGIEAPEKKISTGAY
jgi:hypothetical protein